MKQTLSNFFGTLISGPVLNYEDFICWVDELTSAGKTSGPNQTAALVGYTALNLTRMKRISKTTKLDTSVVEQLNLAATQHWVVITEAWCGDSAQNLPLIAAMTEASNGNISLHIILRDENPLIMDKYLTNGGRSIPKLVAFNENGDELFTWGPRPEAAQELFMRWKKDPQGKSWADFETDLHTWYARNKGADVLRELGELI